MLVIYVSNVIAMNHCCDKEAQHPAHWHDLESNYIGSTVACDDKLQAAFCFNLLCPAYFDTRL